MNINWQKEDLNHIWHPCSQMKDYEELPPIVIERGEGINLYDIEGKCPTICATLYDLKITKDHKRYRRLTITECERLQGLPDGYTSMITKHQAGQALGNGWQVDTVKHILKYLKYLR